MPISERVALPARPTIRIAREKPTGVKRFLIPALGVLVLALAAFIALRVLPKKPTLGPASASGKPSIAVLYFENLTGDPALGYLRTGLTKLLSMGFNESKLVRVLDENSTYGILKKHKLDEASKYTREDLVKIAERRRRKLHGERQPDEGRREHHHHADASESARRRGRRLRSS